MPTQIIELPYYHFFTLFFLAPCLLLPFCCYASLLSTMVLLKHIQGIEFPCTIRPCGLRQCNFRSNSSCTDSLTVNILLSNSSNTSQCFCFGITSLGKAQIWKKGKKRKVNKEGKEREETEKKQRKTEENSKHVTNTEVKGRIGQLLLFEILQSSMESLLPTLCFFFGPGSASVSISASVLSLLL